MIYAYFTLFVGLLISGVAEYYSIVGLTAIFPSSFWPIVIMGASLGIGKITAAVWLKLNWSRATLAYKLYLVPAVVFLMFLTSIGCFGYLSKAHSDQGLVSGDIMAKIAVYDEKIKTAKENIEINRKALKQMDEAVDQVMSRSSDEKGADKAIAIRKSQAKERARLLQEIEIEQKNITKLNEVRAPIAGEIRKIENETGPLKYIAAIIYGDNTNANLLESAVRILIIMIVIVFDPLALVLILAAQQSIRWEKESPTVEDTLIETADSSATESEKDNWAERIAAVENSTPWPTEWHSSEQSKPDEQQFDLSKHPYLFAGGFGFKDSGALVAPRESVEPALPTITDAIIEPEIIASPPTPTPASTPQDDPFALSADNQTRGINTSFGTLFPRNPHRGDIFVRIDVIPHTVYKWDGTSWISVQKKTTDSYLYDTEYIQYLIDKVGGGEYDVELLSETEKDQIRAYLREINSKNNILGDEATQ